MTANIPCNITNRQNRLIFDKIRWNNYGIRELSLCSFTFSMCAVLQPSQLHQR